MFFRVQHLFIYPIKSLGGVSVERAELSSRGLKWDRRMMLVDQEGQFLTQREHPKLALLKTELIGDRIRIVATGALGLDSIDLLLEPESGEETATTIWSDTCTSMIVSKEANDFFTRMTGFETRLVFMPDNSKRPVDEDYGKGAIQSFSDAFPMMVIGAASLDDLNKRLMQNGSKEIMGWDRFRPNVVLNTEVPYEEDQWESFVVGENKFKVVKPCSRCVLITVNQQTSEKGVEPLRTLARYRTTNNKVLFGQNVVNLAHEGFLRVNDLVTVT